MSTLLQIAGCRGPGAQRRQGAGAVVARSEQPHRRLRHRAQDARLHPCPRPDAGARRAGRWSRCPAAAPSAARPVDLHLKALEAMGATLDLARRLCPRRGEGRPQGRDLRVSARLRRRHGKRAHGRHAGQGHNRAQECRARARDRRPRPVPAQDGAPGSRARALPRSPLRASTACNGATHPVVTDRIELGTYMLAPRRLPVARWNCSAASSRSSRPSPKKLETAGISVTENADRPDRDAQGRPRPRRRRDDRTLPGLSHRPSGADDGRF